MEQKSGKKKNGTAKKNIQTVRSTKNTGNERQTKNQKTTGNIKIVKQTEDMPQRRNTVRKSSSGTVHRKTSSRNKKRHLSVSRLSIALAAVLLTGGAVFAGVRLSRVMTGENKNGKIQKNVNAQTNEPGAEASTSEPVQLVLNEYMTTNHTVIFGEGKSPDWIELKNNGTQPLSLDGMTMTDNSGEPGKWQFPTGVSIEPGGYLIVLMDDHEDRNGTDEFLHASFKLGSDDNRLMIFKGSDLVLDTPLYYTEKELSLGSQDGVPVYYTVPTPGTENTAEVFSAEADALAAVTHTVVVSEAAAYQTGGETENADWIELCNISDAAVSLSGWTICKKPIEKNPEKYYTLGEVTLNPGECLLLYSADEDAGTEDAAHLPFKLSIDGDEIYVYDNQKVLKDFFVVGNMHPGDSCGRDISTDKTVFYDIPTPGAPNTEQAYPGYAQLPALSNPGGYAQDGEVITAELPAGMTLYYTDDGTIPDEESPVFENYTLDGNCALRFLVQQEGLLPSEITAVTYITDAVHDVPIVCLTSDPYGLYSDAEGILVDGGKGSSEFPYKGANFWQDWEREVSFEYYTPDGKRELSCNAGTKVHGQYSRAYEQKSLAIYFRSEYGTSEVSYPFFDENNPVTDFSSILLRASGQDHDGARIRDAFVSETAEEYSDLLHMDWRPICVYINGEYNGIYDLREKVSASHVENHEGIKKENLDMIKDNDNVKHGSREDFTALLNYIADHDMSQQENYDYVAQHMDIDNYIDYLITEIFFAKTDGGTNNKHYRDNTGGKWRWILYDVDMSMFKKAAEVDGFNTLEDIFNPYGDGAEAFYVSELQQGLTKNKTFIDKFITRYAELLNSTFLPERLSARLDAMTSQMDAEMKLHGQVYAPAYENWLEYVENYRNILMARRDVCKTEMIRYFDLSDDEIAKLFPDD